MATATPPKRRKLHDGLSTSNILLNGSPMRRTASPAPVRNGTSRLRRTPELVRPSKLNEPRLSVSPMRQKKMAISNGSLSRNGSESGTRNGTSGSESGASTTAAAKPKGKAREVSPEKPEVTREEHEKNELRKALEARIAALAAEVQDLEVDTDREQRRVEAAAQAAEKLRAEGRESTNVSEMIGRLLAANDASFTALPDKPTFDFERETADPSLPSTLPQAVDNPLSQLTVFNALTFTSFSSPVVLDDDAAATAQHHEITGYVGDKHLFFRIHTAVALSSLTVLSISNTLSPWARRELSPALARFAAEKDISATLYAINSYAALARKRAATFARLSHAFPRLLPSFAPRQTHQCKGKQKSDSAYEPSRRDITAQMGEAVLRFRDQQAARQAPKSRVNGSLGGADSGRESGEVEFVLEWRVQVDDVGEAESRVRGEARVPVHWSDVDREGSLKKIGTTFGMLVRDRGVMEAARCMVGLLWPDAEA